VNGRKIPVDGELYFQGYNVEDIIKGSSRDRFRFEEVTYLLLFGSLPDDKQFESFLRILTDLQELSGAFIRDVIMKATSANLMNSLMKSILSLYSYDENPDDISVPNVLRQSLQLIAKMPLLAVYAYQAYRHYKLDGTLMIKNPKKGYSTAENILYMLTDSSANLKPRYSTSVWYFMQSTAAVTTLHLQHTLLHLPVRIRILRFLHQLHL
jgi:citrate synthase